MVYRTVTSEVLESDNSQYAKNQRATEMQKFLKTTDPITGEMKVSKNPNFNPNLQTNSANIPNAENQGANLSSWGLPETLGKADQRHILANKNNIANSDGSYYREDANGDYISYNPMKNGDYSVSRIQPAQQQLETPQPAPTQAPPPPVEQDGGQEPAQNPQEQQASPIVNNYYNQQQGQDTRDFNTKLGNGLGSMFTGDNGGFGFDSFKKGFQGPSASGGSGASAGGLSSLASMVGFL